jgi:hypothetical protein
MKKIIIYKTHILAAYQSPYGQAHIFVLLTSVEMEQAIKHGVLFYGFGEAISVEAWKKEGM